MPMPVLMWTCKVYHRSEVIALLADIRQLNGKTMILSKIYAGNEFKNVIVLVTSSALSVRILSISICGAVTASELNTCNLDNLDVEFKINSSLLVQFI